MRDRVRLLVRRTTPCTTYPFSRRSSVPSWPVINAIWFCGKRNFGVYTKVNLIHVPDHSSEPNMIRTVYCAKAFLGFLRMLPSLPVRHR